MLIQELIPSFEKRMFTRGFCMSQADKSAVPGKPSIPWDRRWDRGFWSELRTVRTFQFALTKTLTRWDASWGADAVICTRTIC
jgi:hypothetical protein